MNEWIHLQTAIYKMVMWNLMNEIQKPHNEEDPHRRGEAEPVEEQVPDSTQVQELPQCLQTIEQIPEPATRRSKKQKRLSRHATKCSLCRRNRTARKRARRKV